MKKIALKISVFQATLLSLLMVSNVALASEVTGNLSTGINSTVGNTVDGIVIAAPTANPAAGAYTSAQSVTLTADGASNIHYTTDGSEPTCSTGTIYSGSILVSSSQTIKAISCYPNNQSSTVASYLYAIDIPATTSVGGGSATGAGGGDSGGGSLIAQPAVSTGPLSTPAQKVDANKDGKIDVLDFNTLMVNWGSASVNNAADFDGNGAIDVFDFNLLMIGWTL